MRRARLSDFETYKILFEDKGEESYHWLYSEKKEKKNITLTDREKEDLEVLKEITSQEYDTYTVERFKEDLNLYMICVIENNRGIQGYVKIFASPIKGRVIISEWAMFKDTFAAKKEVFEKLIEFNPFNFKEISIIAVTSSAAKTLEKLGFTRTEIGGCRFVK